MSHLFRDEVELCRVLYEDPDLYERVPARLREQAAHHCVARVITLARGGWSPETADIGDDGIGLLVLEGVLIRRVGIAGRTGVELIGAGDLARPWQGTGPGSLLRHSTDWRVVVAARLAVLDGEAAARFAHFPQLTGAIADRALGRSRQLAVMMAIIHHPRVETRVHMLLWHLADRWGRVRRDGVHLPLRLSHSLIGDLIAAQRPSVTVALHSLDKRQLIAPLPDGWLLRGQPPGDLLELQPVTVDAGPAGDAG